MTSHSIPFDSDCIDDNLISTALRLNDSEFKIDSDINLLKQYGIKALLNEPVQVNKNDPIYNSGGQFVKESDGRNDFTALFNEHQVVYPDFTHPDTNDWWQKKIRDLSNQLSNDLDGLVLTRNSPFGAITPNTCQNPIYYVPPDIGLVLETTTICHDAVHYDDVEHIRLHNTYQLREHEATVDANLANLEFTFTKHSTPGSSKFGGIMGSELVADWDEMSLALKEILNLGVSGSPIVSMLACGAHEFNSDVSNQFLDELCLRWYQLAAFMPAMYR